jgi:heme exporter protein D
MRVRLWHAVATGLVGVACLVVAYVNRNRELEGWTEYAPREEEGNLAAPLLAEETGSVFEPFDWWNGYLWLGAGIALVVVTLVLAAGAWRAKS